jgi:CTP-dependent riboflavin kinase
LQTEILDKEQKCRADQQASIIEILNKQKNIIKETLDTITKKKEEEEKLFLQLQKDSKSLAIVLKTRWATTQALNRFTELIVKMERQRRIKSEIGKQGNLIEVCENYQKLYKENSKVLLENCREDLQQACDQ